MKNLFVCLAIFGLTISCFLPKANAELSTAEKDFLIQNQVSQDDIDVIPKLKKDAQAKISAWIAAKDLKELGFFINSRNHCKKLFQAKFGDPIPMSPAGWNIDYLTDEEYKRYVEILDNAPW
jgi:hypothetical protein